MVWYYDFIFQNFFPVSKFLLVFPDLIQIYRFQQSLFMPLNNMRLKYDRIISSGIHTDFIFFKSFSFKIFIILLWYHISMKYDMIISFTGNLFIVQKIFRKFFKSQCDFWACLSSKQNRVNKYFSRQRQTLPIWPFQPALWA